jgi:hypothetical protein
VVAKENVKKLLATRYQGFIYSEFLGLYCQKSPYLYPELTPPLSLPSNNVIKECDNESDENENEEKLHLIGIRN